MVPSSCGVPALPRIELILERDRAGVAEAKAPVAESECSSLY